MYLYLGAGSWMSVLLQIGHVIFCLIRTGIVIKILTGVWGTFRPIWPTQFTLFNSGVLATLTGQSTTLFDQTIIGSNRSNVNQQKTLRYERNY
jgi:hypothetical protein